MLENRVASVAIRVNESCPLSDRPVEWWLHDI